jgi:hypothetical protein
MFLAYIRLIFSGSFVEITTDTNNKIHLRLFKNFMY